MKKFLTLLLIAGLAGGCLPAQKKPDSPAAEAKKIEPKTAASNQPAITPESLNEHNAMQKAQALEEEIKHDEKNPPKVVVEAKK